MYTLPNPFGGRFATAFLHNWGIDSRFTARTAFPVLLNGNLLTNQLTGQQFFAGLDVVPGKPLYVYGSQYPGGKSINPSAFAEPAGCNLFSCKSSAAAGDAPRNSVRGFGAWQMDIALRRDFPILEHLKLQFRAEAFNAFNHPNFGFINARYCAPGPFCTFGQATKSLAQSFTGNLSPLYQMGGPRSMQFAMKLIF
jgi:hypothetical protein